MAENDPNYAVDLDEADDKDSRREQATPDDLQYPDIKMQKLFESNDGRFPPPSQPPLAIENH